MAGHTDQLIFTGSRLGVGLHLNSFIWAYLNVFAIEDQSVFERKIPQVKMESVNRNVMLYRFVWSTLHELQLCCGLDKSGAVVKAIFV